MRSYVEGLVWMYALHLMRKGKTSKGKAGTRHLGAEQKKKCYPRTGANPYYHKIDILELFSGNKEPSFLSSSWKGIYIYTRKVNFIWERWKVESVLLAFEHLHNFQTLRVMYTLVLCRCFWRFDMILIQSLEEFT